MASNAAVQDGIRHPWVAAARILHQPSAYVEGLIYLRPPLVGAFIGGCTERDLLPLLAALLVLSAAHVWRHK
jgi:hypothetical protein